MTQQSKQLRKVHVTLELMISKDEFDCMSDLEWAILHKIHDSVEGWSRADDIPFIDVRFVEE